MARANWNDTRSPPKQPAVGRWFRVPGARPCSMAETLEDRRQEAGARREARPAPPPVCPPSRCSYLFLTGWRLVLVWLHCTLLLHACMHVVVPNKARLPRFSANLSSITVSVDLLQVLPQLLHTFSLLPFASSPVHTSQPSAHHHLTDLFSSPLLHPLRIRTTSLYPPQNNTKTARPERFAPVGSDRDCRPSLAAPASVLVMQLRPVQRIRE